jgi:fatty-acyl-CoA synthase
VALRYRGKDTTYGMLDQCVGRLAGLLSSQGIGPGDVVVALMKNSPAFIEISLAVSHLGAVFLPLNFRLSAHEIAYITADAEAKLLCVDTELTGVCPPGLGRLVFSDEAQHDASLLTTGSSVAAVVPCKPDTLFRLMYTSGTTSRPKGVMHSYENFYWKSADHIVALGLTRDTRLLVTGPLYHVGAYDLPGLAVLWAGGMLCIHREFDPDAILGSIERDRLNGAWLAPAMTTVLLTHPGRSKYDCSCLEWTIGGGERTPESRILEFASVFPRARYIDAYGLTESCSGDTLMEAGFERVKIGSTGRSVLHVSITIRDDNGQVLPSGSEGEICLRGPKITKGYWKDPAKTAASFHGEWFRTGDVGYLDEDEFLFITDRKKDMIISGGENIASSEVERVIFELPQVLEVAVIGLPDERWGERPVAVVVLKPGMKLDLDALMAHCRTRLGGFKVPRQMVVRPHLPRNPSGKVLKRELREELTR